MFCCRFARLFKTRTKWTLEEIEPFIRYHFYYLVSRGLILIVNLICVDVILETLLQKRFLPMLCCLNMQECRLMVWERKFLIPKGHCKKSLVKRLENSYAQKYMTKVMVCVCNFNVLDTYLIFIYVNIQNSF